MGPWLGADVGSGLVGWTGGLRWLAWAGVPGWSVDGDDDDDVMGFSGGGAMA